MLKAIKLCALPIVSLFLLANNSSNSFIETESKKEAINSSIEVIEGESLDYNNAFYDDFADGINTDEWGIVEKVWGNENSNSGTRHENVFKTANGLTFRALGSYYDEKEFVNDNAGAVSTDGTKTGGVIASKRTFGPGRFEIQTRIPSIPGAAYAFWGYLNQTIDGKKCYNEIDFEFPVYSYYEANEIKTYSFDKAYISTYTDDASSSNKSTKYPNLISSIADGEYHTLTFDWIYSEAHQQVAYYIDNNYIGVNTTNVSPYDFHVWIGTWVSGNAYNFGLPNFDKAYMDVKYFSYIPFTNQQNKTVNSQLDNYVDEYMNECKDVEFVTRNMLPNTSFDSSSLLGYSYDASKTVISSDYDANGNSNSNGVRIHKPADVSDVTTFAYRIYAKGLQAADLSFKYKGKGSFNAYFYELSSDNTSISKDDNFTISSGSLNKTEYTSISYSINPTSNTAIFEIVFYTESTATGFYIDDLYFGSLISKDPTSSSYSFTLEDSTKENTSWGAIDAISFTNDETQTWKTPFGRYATTTAGYKGLYAAQYDKILNNTEELTPEYNAIRECIISDGLYTGAGTTESPYHMTNIFFMTFGIDYFEDITFNFISLAGTGYQKMSIIYSIDEGNSWHGLSTLRNNSLTDNGAGYYRYSMNGDKSMLRIEDNYYSSIRFGFVGTTWSADTYYIVSSVVINNKNDFKNRLDSKYGNICNAEIGARNLIQKEYSLLSDSDRDELSVTPMKLDPSIDYISGYNYHLSRWNNTPLSTLNNLFIIDNFDSGILLTAAIMVSILSISLFIYINKRKNIKNY